VRLPRPHPADRAAVRMQIVSAAALSLGSGAAQLGLALATDGGQLEWLWVAAGVFTVLAMACGGMYAARQHGAQRARRELAEHQAAQIANGHGDRNEPAPASLSPSRVPGEPGGPEAEVPRLCDPGDGPGGRDLYRMLAEPAGTGGGHLPGADAVDPYGQPAPAEPAPNSENLEQTWPAAGPHDDRWEPAVRALAATLAAEWRPNDGHLSGRGKRQIADDLAPGFPDLGPRAVYDFVHVYMETLTAHVWRAPLSGRDWCGLLDEIVQQARREQHDAAKAEGGLLGDQLAELRDRVVEMVGSARADGMALHTLRARIAGQGSTVSREDLVTVLGGLVDDGVLVQAEPYGRYRAPKYAER
jgi:hypothetical protein